MPQIAIVGGGSFGTAVGQVVAPACDKVTLLMRDAEQARLLNRERCNRRHFPDFTLAPNVQASVDATVLREADIIFLAVPSHVLRDVCNGLAAHVGPQALIVNLAKGLDPEHFTLDRLLGTYFDAHRVGALKGPTFARPLLQGAFSGMTCAFPDPAAAARIAALFAGSAVAVELWPRVDDVEFVSAIKNIYAIAQGICDSIDESSNTRFLFMTKVLAEFSRLVAALGFSPGVVFTFAGVGDLLMTATMNTSRNRTLGFLIGRGFTLARPADGPVIEGINSVRQVLRHLGSATDFAILTGIRDVLSGGRPPSVFIDEMTRPAGHAHVHSTTVADEGFGEGRHVRDL